MIQNTIISRFKWKEDNNNVLLGWYIEGLQTQVEAEANLRPLHMV